MIRYLKNYKIKAAKGTMNKEFRKSFLGERKLKEKAVTQIQNIISTNKLHLQLKACVLMFMW